MTADPWPYVPTGRSSTIGNVTLSEYLESDLADVPAARPAEVRPEILPPDLAATSAIQADGHVDPAAAARWHKAQTELVGLIREENRTLDQVPEAERLPDSLGDWMARRVCELEEAEADEPEIEAIG